MLSATISFAQCVTASTDDNQQAYQDTMLSFLEDVFGVDTSKYTVNIEFCQSYDLERYSEGAEIRFALGSSESNLIVFCRFNGNNIGSINLEGSPFYVQSKPADPLMVIKETIRGYQKHSDTLYMETLNGLL
ncbi:MAG: hypothetical protein LBC12_06200 [Nitrososphaerota archaeon]|nr:hypothetical protein [Nitrososphaerota archaeon]